MPDVRNPASDEAEPPPGGVKIVNVTMSIAWPLANVRAGRNKPNSD